MLLWQSCSQRERGSPTPTPTPPLLLKVPLNSNKDRLHLRGLHKEADNNLFNGILVFKPIFGLCEALSVARLEAGRARGGGTERFWGQVLSLRRQKPTSRACFSCWASRGSWRSQEGVNAALTPWKPTLRSHTGPENPVSLKLEELLKHQNYSPNTLFCRKQDRGVWLQGEATPRGIWEWCWAALEESRGRSCLLSSSLPMLLMSGRRASSGMNLSSASSDTCHLHFDPDNRADNSIPQGSDKPVLVCDGGDGRDFKDYSLFITHDSVFPLWYHFKFSFNTYWFMSKRMNYLMKK